MYKRILLAKSSKYQSLSLLADYYLQSIYILFYPIIISFVILRLSLAKAITKYSGA